MKRDYEDALRLYLPRRTHVVIRIDGRGFHKFTAGWSGLTAVAWRTLWTGRRLICARR